MGNIGAIVKEMATNPAEVAIRLTGKIRELTERRQSRCYYNPEPDWERILHASFGAPMPCGLQQELEPIWQDVTARLVQHGIAPGPASFLGHNDGDQAFIRAIWYLIKYLRASKIVETGVAHGVTSRFALEGLNRVGGGGQLWSIDLPPQTRPDVHDQIGIAVDSETSKKSSWSYIRGSSRRHLHRVLRQTGMVDLFIHDSWHTEHNMRFELETAWPYVRPGGAMVIDDIDLNWAFHRFAVAFPRKLALVCEAEPLRYDPLRQQQRRKGLFGIIIK